MQLYKRSSEGKIETWIGSIAMMNGIPTINLTYGELGGKLVTKLTEITSGKNIGKKNETTPLEQAEAEVQSKIEKQLKKGYVKTLEEAQSGQTDKRIEGAIAPMLAVKYRDIKHKIQDWFIQVKLNGHRCTAIKRNGIVTLWSRARRPIKTMPHILDEVSLMLANCPDGTFLDGELYHHGWTLQRITSAVKKVSDDTKDIQFHVYDCGVDNGSYQATYDKRLAFLMELDYFFMHLNSVTFVATGMVHDDNEVMIFHDKAVSEGFEGAILRDPEGKYEYDRRSRGLVKVKAFEDGEFSIVNVTAGKDKSVVFTVLLSDGQICDVTMSGNKDDNQKYLTNESLWRGRYLTVRYKELTPDGKLFHATGLNIREDL